jgi:hypothetical protein
MAYEPKDGQGSLFKNDKDGVETRPDYKGSIRIDGTDYWLSAWIKEGEKGKWMSMSAQPKDAPRAKSKAEPLGDSEIPF